LFNSLVAVNDIELSDWSTFRLLFCRYSVHELFGFDILLDETYKPWVLEVNISPRYVCVLSYFVISDMDNRRNVTEFQSVYSLTQLCSNIILKVKGFAFPLFVLVFKL